MIEFKLPSLGADMDEGKLLEWKVQAGTHVKRGDIVAVVDTSKAAVEVEAWAEGTVHELIVQPGQTVPVGSVMAILLEAGETAEAIGHAKRSAPATSGAAGPEKAAPAAIAPMAAAEAAPGIAGTAQATPATAPPGPEGRRRVSPIARKRAAELGMDLGAVAGTGPEGAVSLEDVERAAAAVPAKDRQGEMRRAIGAAMSRSKREIPHYYLAEAIPLKLATEWLQTENARRPMTERVLLAALLVKAVALGCAKYPEMNGFYRDGSHWPSAAVHVGVAIALRQGGLVAPAIHDAQGKSTAQLMRELADLVRRTRAGSMRSSEMADPTITVTNLGDQGVEAVFGVIYPPQVALVGFGRPAERPWVEQGVLQVRPVITASLAADHRVSDGHRGALFLAEIRELLQQPEKL